MQAIIQNLRRKPGPWICANTCQAVGSIMAANSSDWANVQVSQIEFQISKASTQPPKGKFWNDQGRLKRYLGSIGPMQSTHVKVEWRGANRNGFEMCSVVYVFMGTALVSQCHGPSLLTYGVLVSCCSGVLVSGVLVPWCPGFWWPYVLVSWCPGVSMLSVGVMGLCRLHPRIPRLFSSQNRFTQKNEDIFFPFVHQ